MNNKSKQTIKSGLENANNDSNMVRRNLTYIHNLNLQSKLRSASLCKGSSKPKNHSIFTLCF